MTLRGTFAPNSMATSLYFSDRQILLHQRQTYHRSTCSVWSSTMHGDEFKGDDKSDCRMLTMQSLADWQVYERSPNQAASVSSTSNQTLTHLGSNTEYLYVSNAALERPSYYGPEWWPSAGSLHKWARLDSRPTHEYPRATLRGIRRRGRG